MKRDFKLYLRLLGYVRPYWRTVAISILAMVISAALEPVLPALMQPLIDKSLIQRHDASLWQVPMFIVLAFVLKGLADYAANVASQTVAQKTIADLRALVFSHQLDLPIIRHRAEEGGRMLSRITYDTSMVGEAVSTAWLTIIRDTLVLIGLLGFLFYTAWQLTFLILLIAPVLALVIRRINRRLRRSSERVQGWMGRVTGLVEEALLGIQEVKIFGAYDTLAGRFNQVNQGLRRENIRVARVQAVNAPLVQILAACSVALVIYTASSLSRKDLLTPGEFVAFITAMSMIFEPIRRLANVNATLQRGLAAAESIFTLLDEKGELGPSVNLEDLNNSDQSCFQRDTLQAPEIQLNSIYYKYPGSSQWVLENLTFTIPRAKTTVIIGKSGSGKSSLLGLLCGFYCPDKGVILVDGKSTTQIPLDVMRRQISLVGQNTLLFNLTVAENLRLARPSASDKELFIALEFANAHDFVSELPLGLNTPTGTLGNSLSGGQRQRLSIARAYLKNAPILILDEPTSALDQDNEKRVIENIKTLSESRTTIIVSHSPENLPHADHSINL